MSEIILTSSTANLNAKYYKHFLMRNCSGCDLAKFCRGMVRSNASIKLDDKDNQINKARCFVNNDATIAPDGN